ncbi:MFS transporter [Clostridium lacusfryxellense]|uniref:MFS transporter n=1 Tax=Clostridium lacusfryxellense TaxID=205328 RepID=UPI001C0D1B54|nr:MFS transporter [Clostridium lacusfryxellense]MBU3114219.1 MFS transporter [Clostridium lacusfryxellense]
MGHQDKLKDNNGVKKQTMKENFSNLFEKFNNDRDFKLFLIVGLFTGIASGINSTVFNNFLSDTYKLTAAARGIVEFPRELPGVLIVVVLGILSFLGDTRIAIVGMIFASLGMLGLGMFSPTFATMLLWMMLLSLGTHIFMPLSAGIGMNLSQNENYGARLGRYSAYNLIATIIGYAIVGFGFKYFNLTYQVAFVIASVFYIFAAFFLGIMKNKKPKTRKITIIFRKKYTLYYCLSVVNGARKQIFLTFAPWVLIKVYNVDPPTFAILGLIIAVLSIFTRTIVGNAIDKRGERFVLSLEAVVLIVICIGYSFAADLVRPSIAVVVIASCYIIDNSLSVVEMARSTYIKKIAICPEDVIPTLSAGTSFDHIIAMSIPFVGGILWATMGYKYVFIVAAFIAVINLYLSLKIKID